MSLFLFSANRVLFITLSIYYGINLLKSNILFNKNIINKWIVKFVLFAILKKVLIIFTTSIENLNTGKLKEA